MPTVRTTMRPDLDLEVDQIEYLDLQRQGLLVADKPATPEPAPQPATKKTPAAPASGTTKEG